MEQVRQYLAGNSKMVAAYIAAFILVVGGTAYAKPADWWKPAALFAVIGVLAVVWRSARIVASVAVSAAVTVMTASVAMLAGTSFAGGDSNAGLVWTATVLAVYFMSLFLSYSVASTRSRWFGASLASVIGFSAGYMAMPLRSIPLLAIAVAVVGMATFLAYYLLYLRGRHIGRKVPQVVEAGNPEDMEKGLNDSVDGYRLRRYRTMGRRNPMRHMLLAYGPDLPLIAFIPIRLDSPMRQDVRKGVLYKGRRIVEFYSYWTIRAGYRIGRLPAIIVFVDEGGQSDTYPRLLTITSKQGGRPLQPSIMSAPTKRKTMEKAADTLIATYASQPLLTDRDVRRLDGMTEGIRPDDKDADGKPSPLGRLKALLKRDGGKTEATDDKDGAVPADDNEGATHA